METIAQVLRVLFQETKSDDVIDSWLHQGDFGEYLDHAIDNDLFSRQLVTVDFAKTIDQGNVIGKVAMDKLFRVDTEMPTLTFSKKASVFNVLLHYTYYRYVLLGLWNGQG